MEEAAVGLGEAGSSHETHLPSLRDAGDDLTWTPAWRLRAMMGARQLSPVELTEHFLAQIERLNPSFTPFARSMPRVRGIRPGALKTPS